MEGKEPIPLENLARQASSSSTSPHIGDYGGGMQKLEGNDHDVFLSCEEVYHPYVNYLRKSLVDAGIDTFYVMNSSNDEIDPEILKSLTQSKISIPIMAPYISFSKLCIRELVHMLRCKKSSGQIVLPMVIRGKLSDKQGVEGSFKHALSSYEGRVDKTELGEWRKALAEVCSLRGWEVEKFGDGGTGALIIAVVARVVSLLKRTFKLPKELVRIDDHETGIMRSIDPKYNDTRIIGICGVHGSGKTTLAKVLWNKLFCDFEHLNFIPNIRETSRRMGIKYLQEELICGILQSPHTVSNVNEGIDIIKSQFASKKILVILDDVDDKTHLDALLGDGSWLKAGSIIIITTGHMSILDKANADPRHQLKEWTQDQALTLFSRHFFGKDSPPEAHEPISREVVSGIPRIPLVLDRICSSFLREREEAWRDELKKLKHNVDEKNMGELLPITYEILDYEQQHIFLDIACFFIRSSKQHPFYMWDSDGFLAKKGIEVLKGKSLIEIDKDDKLIMSNKLRDFGRKIASEGYGGKQPSRIWSYEKAQRVLDNNEGTNMIQAICLDKYDSNRSYTGENFKGLIHLRFLKVCGANFTGDFENMLSELRYLHWERCPSNFVAANFPPKQLVVLDLSGGEISEYWGGWGPIKMATKLKVLNLSSCPHLKRIPDLTAFESLEILILEKCENLEEIHPSIEDNKSLISLNVSGCRRVEELPIGVGRLEELKELLINDTAIREIPMLGKGLRKLEILNASDCEQLAQLSESMSSLVSLTRLDLSHSGIEELPNSMVFPKSLTRLDLSYSWIEKLPESLSSLFSLTQLDLSHSGIREFPKILTTHKLPLTQLDLSHTGIEELPYYIFRLGALTHLNLSYLGIKQLPKSMRGLGSLQYLLLQGCYLLRHFPDWIRESKSLIELDLRSTGIAKLPNNIQTLKNLKILVE